MASAIRPIEARSVHQIQSGQVIVDLCSVVKELVENALDADASTIEVRFKNNGLDAIEVQDNGTGISEANYGSLALKHYTSKLSTYEDLLNVQTFGFRGEALSSLCALSEFSVVTAQAHEAPKGKRLEFELSGKLKSTSLIPAQKGTTVTVENLFAKLPVRQKELSKNIKREYGKVLGLLHAYACVSTEVKFIVKNAMPKGRSSVVFSTKGNSTTRDNIANVYGSKMLPQLIELNLKLNLDAEPTAASKNTSEVTVSGHISKPVFGEGRQTPDRQMFFVNGRPCGLPQIAKAINEVYKSYNVSQSPFIFADFQMDTNAYDVNVSPDKRTILLHNAVVLTDHLKTALTERFDDAEQTVPQSQIQLANLPSYRPLTMLRASSQGDEAIQNLSSLRSRSSTSPSIEPSKRNDDSVSNIESEETQTPKNLLKAHFGNIASTREDEDVQAPPNPGNVQRALEKRAEKVKKVIEKQRQLQASADGPDDIEESPTNTTNMASSTEPSVISVPVRDFNARMTEQQRPYQSSPEGLDSPLTATSRQPRAEEIGVMPSAFDRMRPRRASPELATITIGDKVITRMIGSVRSDISRSGTLGVSRSKQVTPFSQRLQKFDLSSDKANLNGDHEPSSDAARDDSEGEEHSNLVNFERVEHDSENRGISFSDDFDRRSVSANGPQSSEQDQRAQEEDRVAELIRLAEEANAGNSKEQQRRTTQALRGSTPRDSTVDQIVIVETDPDLLALQAANLWSVPRIIEQAQKARVARKDGVTSDEEERLSLTISKADFSQMHIAGQFNLGFIVAVRHKDKQDPARSKDEIFIIDQHASDEKYNFERLQAETVVGNQRLVHPATLDLTAVEEEIVMENESALCQNGFIIEADHSGELPVGQRCKLLSLPLSKEVTFNTRDLEELIHLLSDSHISTSSTYVPRPSKVRKMFAMRACRSSIMIGKTLSKRQMRNVLDHMGRIDKPWNCPHGRPTMRHLTSLDNMDDRLWKEGDGIVSANNRSDSRSEALANNIWKAYIE